MDDSLLGAKGGFVLGEHWKEILFQYWMIITQVPKHVSHCISTAVVVAAYDPIPPPTLLAFTFSFSFSYSRSLSLFLSFYLRAIICMCTFLSFCIYSFPFLSPPWRSLTGLPQPTTTLLLQQCFRVQRMILQNNNNITNMIYHLKQVNLWFVLPLKTILNINNLTKSSDKILGLGIDFALMPIVHLPLYHWM